MKAYELKAHLDAGLLLAGEEDGHLLWMGDDLSWKTYEMLLAAYETENNNRGDSGSGREGDNQNV